MAFEPAEKIKKILKKLPTSPGVYLHKDKDDVIIYVGKAINLRSRVRSYFAKNVDSNKTERLRQRITDIEIITTDSELEALLLENTLIKKHKPQYNVRLKDDKRYPYIKVSWKDPFPKVQVTRRMDRDGSRYFGPYTSVWAVHQTLDLLRKIFPFLTCDREITGNDPRACLYFDIKLCSGPCIGRVSQEEYRSMISHLMDFLGGKSDAIVKDIQEKMLTASEEMDFEQAAVFRDQLKAIDRVVEKQKVFATANTDQDIIAFAREDGDACVQIFFVRYGRLIGREYFLLDNTEDEADESILETFLTQFYDEAAHIPKEVLLPSEVSEAMVIEEWLRTKRQQKVTIQVPIRGKKRELVEMAKRNAGETLSTLRQQWSADRSRHVNAMNELQEALELPKPPTRIECYDISHTQGSFPVGSMVVFVQGAPLKKDYRRFNIQTVTNDDYGAMKEVLTRRLKRYIDNKGGSEESSNTALRTVGKKVDSSFSILPDLLIVDGGKGQLTMAVEVLKEFDLAHVVPVVGLAKREEELFKPGKLRSILLPRKSQGLYLVQRVRDEAHRFANTGHRKRRSKAGTASILDSIPGVGPTRRKKLLSQFGSLDDIRGATVEEIASVPGIPMHVAEAIKMGLD
ncbi:MAG: excinuclease ABC subunit UvrC [Anaerolineae bacterium]